ncbi:hypothetical protein BR93DRAFT_980850 [Coniochaeta sp. PMI_546]|nr:hypothetical protein BR93DRAFT_980850 [Coniochaeta sp. PMI_546]
MGQPGLRATSISQHSHGNNQKVFFPPQSPSPPKTGQCVHPAGALSIPHVKRKAETPAEGRTKRRALTDDNGSPDDTVFSRENGKLVILIAQNIWSTLMSIGLRMVESRNLFGLQIAFNYSPSKTEGGLSKETRNEMIMMHQSLLYCSLITYGLQGCRVQELPTFAADEVYMPSHVFPPGSQNAIFITPVRSPAMPVAEKKHPGSTSVSPTPSQPKPTQNRKGTGPAKARAKKPSVCIPAVHHEDNGALLSLESGEKVPVAGMSKNQLKKMARQAKSSQPLDDGGEMAVAYRNGDFATVEKLLDQMKAKDSKASTSPQNNKGSGSIPPPPPKKQPRESRAVKEALAEGAKAIASGKARPPTHGRSHSVTTNAANSNSSPASNPFAVAAANSNNSPASQALTQSPYHLGGSPAQLQPQQQPTMPFQFDGSPPPVSQCYQATSCPQQVIQGYGYDNQYQPQQHPNLVQNVDPQLTMYDTPVQQACAPVEQVSTGLGIVQDENQEPAPASVDELLKVSGMIASTTQQEQMSRNGLGQQATSSANTHKVDGVEVMPIDNIGQQGQVISNDQCSQLASSANTDKVDGIEIMPVIDSGNVLDPHVKAPVVQAKGPSVVHIQDIKSYNGMPVINGEVQTNGYGLQPLVAIMPQGISRTSTGYGSHTENDSTTTASPQIVFPEPAATANQDVNVENDQQTVNQDFDMEELFGPEEPLSGLDALTQYDLEQVFDEVGFMEEHEEKLARELVEDAAKLQQLADFNNGYSNDSAMAQFDGGASPMITDKTDIDNKGNFYRDTSGSKPSSVLAGAAARAQQTHQNNIAQQAQGQAANTVPNTASKASSSSSVNQPASTPEQIRAHELYRQHLLHTQRDLTALKARDNRRNRALAAGRDLPSQAERERRAKRKRAHERIAEIKYITSQAVVFPKGHAYRFGYEESIEEMENLEEEVRNMGDRVLTDREYGVVREKGYRCEEHWIPEI